MEVEYKSDSRTFAVMTNKIMNKLLAMKTEAGSSLQKFLISFNENGCYKEVEVMQNASDHQKFSSLRAQFFQALYDNLGQRFPAEDILSDANVLDKSSWPEDPLKRALYGDKSIASMCKQFDIASADAAQVVIEYALYKQGQHMGANLATLVQTLKILPISSAACERGFSQMNLQHTTLRNRLTVAPISNLLMISINGPSLKHWNARKYVISWLKSGRHGALDKPTGKATIARELRKSTELFA
jgi:hypothetical protein